MHRATRTISMLMIALVCSCSAQPRVKGDVEGHLAAQYEFEDDYLDSGGDM